MPLAQEIAACHWLTEAELSVYSEEYGRTGFQGGLQGYRIGGLDQELKIFAGRTIDVPSLFIGGKSDWGVYQTPGGLESVEQTLTTQYKGTVLVEGAGHWVQQEQAEKVSKIFIDFLAAALSH
jgi:pimeloyl-ACP methyl ester carboxylesterase